MAQVKFLNVNGSNLKRTDLPRGISGIRNRLPKEQSDKLFEESMETTSEVIDELADWRRRSLRADIVFKY